MPTLNLVTPDPGPIQIRQFVHSRSFAPFTKIGICGDEELRNAVITCAGTTLSVSPLIASSRLLAPNPASGIRNEIGVLSGPIVAGSGQDVIDDCTLRIGVVLNERPFLLSQG